MLNPAPLLGCQGCLDFQTQQKYHLACHKITVKCANADKVTGHYIFLSFVAKAEPLNTAYILNLQQKRALGKKSVLLSLRYPMSWSYAIPLAFNSESGVAGIKKLHHKVLGWGAQ